MSVESANFSGICGLVLRNAIARAATQCTAPNAEDGSAGGEEVLQEGAALGLQNAAAYVDAMVEPRITYYVEERANSPRLWIEGAEDEPSNPSQHESTGAHGAWLEGDNQRDAGQSPGVQVSGRLAQYQDLCVRGRIMSNLTFVAGGSQHVAGLIKQYRTDGYIAVH